MVDKDYWKRRYLTHKKELNDTSNAWRKANPDRVSEINKRCYDRKVIDDPNWLKKRNVKALSWHFEITAILFKILGGERCQCKRTDCFHKGLCLVEDRQILQFDHINGNGSKDRGKHSNRLNYLFYIQNPKIAKSTLQVLCANCNWKKRKMEREFFHKYPEVIMK